MDIKDTVHSWVIDELDDCIRALEKPMKEMSLEAALEIVDRHHQDEIERRRKNIDLPCPCCNGETDDTGHCKDCNVYLNNDGHVAIDCDKYHTHSNRCFVLYEQFAKNHPGITPKEHSLQQAREHYERFKSAMKKWEQQENDIDKNEIL